MPVTVAPLHVNQGFRDALDEAGGEPGASEYPVLPCLGILVGVIVVFECAPVMVADGELLEYLRRGFHVMFDDRELLGFPPLALDSPVVVLVVPDVHPTGGLGHPLDRQLVTDGVGDEDRTVPLADLVVLPVVIPPVGRRAIPH